MNRQGQKRTHWGQQLITIFIFVASMSACGFWINTEPWGPEIELRGTVSGLQHYPDGYGPSFSVLTVKLDKIGLIVPIPGTEHLPYQKGQPVIVKESTSKVLRRRRYQFVRFAADTRSP